MAALKYFQRNEQGCAIDILKYIDRYTIDILIDILKCIQAWLFLLSVLVKRQSLRSGKPSHAGRKVVPAWMPLTHI